MAPLILAHCHLTASFPVLSKPLLGQILRAGGRSVPRSPAQISWGLQCLNGAGGVDLEGSLSVQTLGDSLLGVVVLISRLVCLGAVVKDRGVSRPSPSCCSLPLGVPHREGLLPYVSSPGRGSLCGM